MPSFVGDRDKIGTNLPKPSEQIRAGMTPNVVNPSHFKRMSTDDDNAWEEMIGKINAHPTAEFSIITTTDWTLSGSHTIPANASMQSYGGLIDGAGSLTFAAGSAFWASRKKFFGSSLTVTFGDGVLEEVRPEWWGAKADGTTDSTAAINAAAASGQDVRFSRGTYVVNSTLTPSAGQTWHLPRGCTLTDGSSWTGNTRMIDIDASNVTIEGGGRILNTNDNVIVGINILADTANISNIQVRGITLENIAIDTGGAVFSGFGVRVWDPANDVHNIVFDDLTLIDVRWGVYFRASSTGDVYNALCSNSVAYGSTYNGSDRLDKGFSVDRTESRVGDIIFDSCIVKDNRAGFGIASCHNVQVVNCRVVDPVGGSNNGYGVVIEATGSHGDCTDIDIVNPQITGCNGAGIILSANATPAGGAATDAVRRVRIQGGYIKAATTGMAAGIFCQNADEPADTREYGVYDLRVKGVDIQGDRGIMATRGIGVYCQNVRGAMISDCRVWDLYKSGVDILNSTRVSVSNIQARDNNIEDIADNFNCVKVRESASHVAVNNCESYWENEPATNVNDFSVDSLTITGATNATPIVVTAADHGLLDGDIVLIHGAKGNTATNGTHYVEYVDDDNIALYSDAALSAGVAGNGAWTGDGQIFGAHITFEQCRYENTVRNLTTGIDTAAPGAMVGQLLDKSTNRYNMWSNLQATATPYASTRRSNSIVYGAGFNLATASLASDPEQCGIFYANSDPRGGGYDYAPGSVLIQPEGGTAQIWVKLTGTETDWWPLDMKQSLEEHFVGGGTAAYTMEPDHGQFSVITDNATNFTGTLVDASTVRGRVFTFWASSIGTATCTWQRAGTDSIYEGATSGTQFTLNATGAFVVLEAVANNSWIIRAGGNHTLS